MEEDKLVEHETTGKVAKSNKKYTQYCYRECNSSLSTMDAKKLREMIKNKHKETLSFWQGSRE